MASRKAGWDDGESWLLESSSLVGSELSFGVDRGDLYVFYRNASGSLAYRRHLQGLGWDAAESVLDSLTTAHYPTARTRLSDGQVDVAWVRTSGGSQEVMAERFAVSRPFVRELTVSPSPFVPLAGQTASVSYSLADDLSSTLAVKVRVYDSQEALVRTLVDGSQGVGVQSVVWDGRSDGGVVQSAGTYSVRVSATDEAGLAAPEQQANITITRQATTSYGYDRLSRLTSVSAPSGATSYEYDPVGNRLSLTRGSATSYTYDRADRIQSAGAVAYQVDGNGNLRFRGADEFQYDQANRLKSATIEATTSSYTYDGDGKRASKTVGGQSTSYVYDVNRSLPVVLEDGSRKYVWGVGLAYAVDGAGNVQVYHADGLGSVRAISDASAQVVQTHSTDEFGVVSLSSLSWVERWTDVEAASSCDPP